MHPALNWIFFICTFTALVIIGQDIRSLHHQDEVLYETAVKPDPEIKKIENEVGDLEHEVHTCETAVR